MGKCNAVIYPYCGPKKSGKTSLVEALVRELSARGYRLGTIKHGSHRFQMDYERTDTWRHRQAGAAAMMIYADQRLGLVRDLETPLPLSELVAHYFADCDLVLVEGFRAAAGPAIVLGEAETVGPVLARLPHGWGQSPEKIRELADCLETLQSQEQAQREPQQCCP